MKILVTGGSSMVGKHLKKYLPNAIYISSKDCDLKNQASVRELLFQVRPDKVIHLAAKVGGILDNIQDPVGFFEDNILINTNLLRYSYQSRVDHFIGILSTCIYPDKVEEHLYPMNENLLHLGPPTETNFAYGYAKRCLAVQIDAYNKQYQTKYNYIIPCNLYSEHDHFEGNKAHFLSSLINKIYLAKRNNHKNIQLMGSGTPLRQFMYAGDLAKIIRYMLNNNISESFCVAPDNHNHTIDYMARTILDILGKSKMKIEYDSSKPDGQYRKDVSNELMKKFIPSFEFSTFQKTIPRIYNNNAIESFTQMAKDTNS